MIYLKKITIKDFLSHELTEVGFDENDQVLIDGASGAGKSSIFDAIIWALYGEGRVDNRSLVRKGAKKASVILELIQDRPGGVAPYDKQTVIIERTSTPKGKHELAVSIFKPENMDPVAHPLTGVRELQAWIDKDLIGASYLLFINSVAYVQGSSESFVSQSAPRRKELLLEIVKADDYSKYYEKARQALSGVDGIRQKSIGQSEVYSMRLTALKASKGDKTVHLTSITENTAALILVETAINGLEKNRAAYAALEQTVNVLDRSLADAISSQQEAVFNLDTAKKKIETKGHLSAIANTERDYQAEISVENETLKGLWTTMEEANKINQARADHMAKKPTVRDSTAELLSYQTQIKRIESEPVCPSGAECPYSGDHTKQVKDLKDVVDAILARRTKEDIALAEWSLSANRLPPNVGLFELSANIVSTQNAIKELEAEYTVVKHAKEDLAVIEKVELTIPFLEKTLEEKTARIEEIKKQKEELNQSLNQEVDINILYIAKQLERDSLKEAITKAGMELVAIDRDEKEIATLEADIARINGPELKALEEKSQKIALVKDAFGPKGIETIVIDYLLPKLEDKINEVLGKLSDFRVRLDTQRKSADGESVIEGLFITILNDMNEEMPFESYSGGEKLKISVAISEALATLQKVGFRLFDETFMGLDENSTESFADVLISLQQSFGQVFCISHLLQIKDLFSKKITVTKRNGVSFCQ